ncbi:MAG: hypothetical protein RIS76_4128 [Verrucomicrobiota bacterium]|jgi:hypothetical protein
MKPIRLVTLTLLATTLLAHVTQAQQASVPERLAALKAALETSKARLKQYEWIETTVVSLKGEEKSRKQERCFYGAEGSLTKVELSETPEAAKKRGLRGRIAERKKEEMTDAMKKAVALVKAYVPPNPALIQAAKDAGKVSIEVLEPGKRARLNFKDYEKAGDTLGVEVDLISNRPLGMKVATYLDTPKDIVTLEVRMGQLDDGTVYSSDSTLDVKSQNLTVAVQNNGYRKMTPGQ